MTSDEAIVAAIDVLEAAGVPYMVVGSLSSNFYGIARSTKDADIVLELGKSHSLRELVARLGAGFHFNSPMSFETVTFTKRFELRCADTDFVVELFLLSDDPLDRERFARRRRVPLFDRQVWLPTAEDVVVWKLRWAHSARRRKDLDDARDVLAVQGDNFDWDYIYRWCDEFGTRATLDEIRGSLPK